MPKAPPVFRVKIWNTGYADKVFSNFIRKRDGKCKRCGSTTKPLDNSHYWERGRKGTRFDPRNCIALCRECHTIWEHQKNTEYMKWMIKWLGEEEYRALELRARTMMKMRDAVLELMAWIKEAP